MAAILALGAGLLWGSGDFLGGHTSRRFSVLKVLVWSQVATFLLVWIAVGVGATAFGLEVSLRSLLIGAAGGVAGVIALAAFYRALAIGPMAVVPPIAAAGVVLPVGVGLAAGAPPTIGVYVGIAIAIVGVVLASIGGSAPSSSTGGGLKIAPLTLGLCLVAAAGFALVFVAIDSAAGTTAGGALVATAGIRAGGLSLLVLATIALRARPWQAVTAPNVALFAAIGILDTSANLLFALAAAYGRLEVVAVLASLYPAVTSALAHLVLGERLGRVQLVGVVLALAGVALLASR